MGGVLYFNQINPRPTANNITTQLTRLECADGVIQRPLLICLTTAAVQAAHCRTKARNGETTLPYTFEHHISNKPDKNTATVAIAAHIPRKHPQAQPMPTPRKLAMVNITVPETA